MSEATTLPTRCPWCQFHPDTRKVFAFFVVLAALVAVSKGLDEPGSKAAHVHKKQIRLVPMAPMATESAKHPTAAEKPLPLLIEKEPIR